MTRRYPAPPLAPHARLLRFVAFALPAVAVGIAAIEYIKEAWR